MHRKRSRFIINDAYTNAVSMAIQLNATLLGFLTVQENLSLPYTILESQIHDALTIVNIKPVGIDNVFSGFRNCFLYFV